MLRLGAVINLDGSIEVGGTFVDNLDACTLEASSSWPLGSGRLVRNAPSERDAEPLREFGV
jgi:hypothetical protein